MDESHVWFGLIVQTIVILLGIGASFVRSRERIAKIEERCSHIESNTNGLRGDHQRLSAKVDGISRHVANIEGRCSARNLHEH